MRKPGNAGLQNLLAESLKHNVKGISSYPVNSTGKIVNLVNLTVKVAFSLNVQSLGINDTWLPTRGK